jgi:hypothetical protein
MATTESYSFGVWNVGYLTDEVLLYNTFTPEIHSLIATQIKQYNAFALVEIGNKVDTMLEAVKTVLNKHSLKWTYVLSPTLQPAHPKGEKIALFFDKTLFDEKGSVWMFFDTQEPVLFDVDVRVCAARSRVWLQFAAIFLTPNCLTGRSQGRMEKK